ncbi:MAG: ATP-binding protein, partial [Campylobacterota bacterium]
MESISKGNTKLGAIASDLGIHSSYLPKYIHKLIELDIIQKEVPVTENNPTKSKMGRYRIKDKFLNFWFHYVYKNYSYLEIGQIDLVADEVAINFNDRFVSFAFEDYVLHELMRNPRKYIDFIPKKAGRWWNNKQEIDIVAFDDDHMAFIECKWQNSVNIARVKEKLVQKATTIKTNKQKSYHVVTKNDYLQGG